MRPLINGNAYSHSSIALWVPTIGEQILGLESLSYSDDLEPGLVYGTLPVQLGRTMGQYKTEGQAVLWKQQFDELIATLPKNAFGIYAYDWTVCYGDLGVPSTVDVLIGVRIASVAIDSSQGNEATKVTMKLSIFNIERNGRSLMSAGI